MVGALFALDEHDSRPIAPVLSLATTACTFYASPVFLLLSTSVLILLAVPLWRSSRLRVTSLSRLFCVLCYSHGSAFCALGLSVVAGAGKFIVVFVPMVLAIWFVVINLLGCPMKGFSEKILPSAVYLVLGLGFYCCYGFTVPPRGYGFYWLSIMRLDELVRNAMGW